MSTVANRKITITYAGDIDGTNVLDAAVNNASPAAISFITLASGANTITPPAGFKSATILPPAANAVAITLKGVTGDTGVRLHNTDPSSFGIDSSVATFCLTAASSIAGVIIIWT